MVMIYLAVTKATWTAFTEHCQQVKTPFDNLVRIVSWARGGWAQGELKSLLDNTVDSRGCSEEVGLGWHAPAAHIPQHQQIAETLVSFVLALASTRSFSHATYRFPFPPTVQLGRCAPRSGPATR